MIIFSNRVVTSEGIKPAFLKVENGKIEGIYDGSANLKADVDYGNHRIIPGVIDTHNHGGFGYYFDNADEEGLRACLKGHASMGVTGMFPTTTVADQYPVLAKIAREDNEGARVLGIHSEGPWESRVGEKGTLSGYPEIDLDLVKHMVDKAEGWLRLFDIPPEVPGALEVVDYLVSKGVTAAACHTNANFEEMNRGIDHGITVATHLLNVMTGLHHRDVGTAGASILSDKVDCELICDGLHVSLPMIKLVMRMKDNSRIMMISDNGNFIGAPSGKYRGGKQFEHNDRAVLTVTDEGFVLSQTGRLTGSGKAVMYGIYNLVEKLGMNLEEVVKMASLNPAKKYGFASKGEIAVGKDLDIAVIDDEYNVLATYVEGRKVWDAALEKAPFNPVFLKEYKLD